MWWGILGNKVQGSRRALGGCHLWCRGRVAGKPNSEAITGNHLFPLTYNRRWCAAMCHDANVMTDVFVCVCVRLLPVVRQRVITHRGYTSVVNTNVAAPLNYRRIWGIIIHSVFIFVSCKNVILMRLGNTQYNNIFWVGTMQCELWYVI